MQQTFGSQSQEVLDRAQPDLNLSIKSYSKNKKVVQPTVSNSQINLKTEKVMNLHQQDGGDQNVIFRYQVEEAQTPTLEASKRTTRTELVRHEPHDPDYAPRTFHIKLAQVAPNQILLPPMAQPAPNPARHASSRNKSNFNSNQSRPTGLNAEPTHRSASLKQAFLQRPPLLDPRHRPPLLAKPIVIDGSKISECF